MTPSEHCGLCVNHCKDLKSLYDVNGHGNELYDITRKYFHPMILDMDTWEHVKGICVQCWQHISDFHEFQAFILATQLKLINAGDVIKKEVPDLVGPSTSKVQNDTTIVKQEFISLTETEILKANGDGLLISLPELHLIDVHGSNEGGSSAEDSKEIAIPTPSTAIWPDSPLMGDDQNWSELELTESESDDLSSDDEWVLAKYARKRNTKPIRDNTKAGISVKDQLTEAGDNDELSSELALTDSDADNGCSLNSDTSAATVTFEDYTMIQKQKLNDLVAKWLPNIKCTLCLESCTNFSLLQKHYRQKHPKQKFSITCCNRKLYAPIRIREHLLLHDNPDTFKCQLCGRYYTTTATLNGHMALHHPESYRPKKYTCRKCGKSFDAWRRLSHHKQVNHSAIVYKSKRRRTAHVAVNGPKAFPCNDCGKIFDKYRSFTQHMWYSHSTVERKHKRMVCDKSCRLKCDLHKHASLHSDYRCTFCPKTFKEIGALHEHRRADHSQLMASNLAIEYNSLN